MGDQDGTKIVGKPKVRISNTDILILEKMDSRNVIELFDDIKSCALTTHYDFRRDECKSCETIHNKQSQQLYNQRKIQMRKTLNPKERFAFHLVTSREVASNIAMNGLSCEQLVFPIDQCLGNPKDGVHLSRRPDVLLASTQRQGLNYFGLLVCKILLGKGYATIPSKTNKQLSAQIDYDYHFCKIQSLTKGQFHVTDLLANSLIFCYEHRDLTPIARPSQILPLAVLWYHLKEKFSSRLMTICHEFQRYNEDVHTLGSVHTNKQLSQLSALSVPPVLPISSLPPPLLSIMPPSESTFSVPPLTTMTQKLTPATTLSSPKGSSTTVVPRDGYISSLKQNVSSKHSGLRLLPFSSLNKIKYSTNHRDPRLLRSSSASLNIKTSSTHVLSQEESQYEMPLASESLSQTQTKSPANIPLNSVTELVDPRLQAYKTKRNIFYLESNAVRYALQIQKRMNDFDSKSSTKSKAKYTLIPYTIRSTSSEEYEANIEALGPRQTNYSSLFVSVVDCIHFGIKTKDGRSYIDMEKCENQLAYEQISISSRLIHHERKLKAYEIYLNLRERRQRKIQERTIRQRRAYSTRSRAYINNGRKLLKEHRFGSSSLYSQVPLESLSFFSYVYRNENQPNVKLLLAELLGILLEKYGVQEKSTIATSHANKSCEVSCTHDLINDTTVDMDLESPSSHTLDYRDEHDAESLPPSNIKESNNNRPRLSFSPAPGLSTEGHKALEKFNYDQHELIQRNEFKTLLAEEANKLRLPNVADSYHHSRCSRNDNEKNVNNDSASTEKLKCAADGHEGQLSIQTANKDQQTQEPEAKRMKSVSDIGTVSSVALVNNTVRSKDVCEKDRRAEVTPIQTISWSDSITASTHKASINEFRVQTPASSTNICYRSQKNDYPHQLEHTHKRFSQHYPQNVNNITSACLTTAHRRRYKYHQGSTVGQNVVDNTLSSPIQRLMNYSFNQPKNSDSHQRSYTTNVDRNSRPSYYNESASNYNYYQSNNSSQPPPLMSTTLGAFLPNPNDSKQLSTTECLQTFVPNGFTPFHNDRAANLTDHPSAFYTMNSHGNNNHAWSSSR